MQMKTSKTALIVMVLLVAAVLIAYGSVTDLGFTSFDDDKYVTNNPHVLQGLSVKTAQWAFTHAYAANWHPLTWMSHMLDVRLFGLNPVGHHMVSLLFHILNVVLLFLVLNRMTKSVWRSAFVAMLFGVHPIHVESVAWIAERKDVLSTFFWMLTMLAYVYYVERRNAFRYLAVLVLFALGLMAKPMLVSLPLILLLLDYWPLQRQSAEVGWGRLVAEKAPLFVLAAASCVITIIVQRAGGAVLALEKIPVGIRIANAFVSVVKYIGKMLWPTQLSAYYPHPMDSLPLWIVAGAIVLCVVATIMAIIVRKRAPFVTVGWTWYLITLVPVIGIVQVGEQAMADRYSYVPLIGLFLLIAWGVPEFLSRREQPATRQSRRQEDKKAHSQTEPRSEFGLATVAMVVVLAMMLMTFRQVGCWKDDFALFSHALDVAPDNYFAHDHVGATLFEKGEYSRALKHATRAVEIKPDSPSAQSNLGGMLVKLGKPQDALAHLQSAVKLSPGFAEAQYNLGNVLLMLGRIAEAEVHIKNALRIDSTMAQALCCYGFILYRKGNVDEAIEHLREAVRLNPDYWASHYYLGTIFLQLGKTDEAIAALLELLRINPNDLEGHRNLSLAYEKKGDLTKAQQEAEVYRIIANRQGATE
jgi:protein O-mannosyl-transferase